MLVFSIEVEREVESSAVYCLNKDLRQNEFVVWLWAAGQLAAVALLSVVCLWVFTKFPFISLFNTNNWRFSTFLSSFVNIFHYWSCCWCNMILKKMWNREVFFLVIAYYCTKPLLDFFVYPFAQGPLHHIHAFLLANPIKLLFDSFSGLNKAFLDPLSNHSFMICSMEKIWFVESV